MQADVGGVLGKEEKIKSFNQSHSVYFSIVPSLHAAYFSSCGCCRELPKSHQGQGKAPLNPVTINCVRALNGSLKLFIKERNHQFYLMHCPARCPETHHMHGLYKTAPCSLGQGVEMLLPQAPALGCWEHHCHGAGPESIALLQPSHLLTGSWQTSHNQRSVAVICITGCVVEFDPCNKPSDCYSHLLLLLLLLWNKDNLKKREYATSTVW